MPASADATVTSGGVIDEFSLKEEPEKAPASDGRSGGSSAFKEPA